MKTLNKILNLVILIALFALAVSWGFKQRSDKLIYKDNFEAEVYKNGRQVYVTEMEYSRLYSKIDSLSRELGKKPKHIVQVLKIDYQIKDTAEAALTGDTVYLVRNDTIFVQPDTLRFVIEKSCYKLAGYVYNSRIKAEIDYRDKPIVIFDRQRSKKFLFIKYGHWKYSATFYSQCSKKKMWIQDNILIKRK